MTLVELIEQAAARLDAAQVGYGHGTTNAFDEAAWLVMWRLGLPLDALDENEQRAVSDEERQQADTLIEERIATRKPAAYLTKQAWLQGVPFYVDERAIVPRSFVAEVLADRFDTAGRALQLLNHPQTADQRPWATPENLRRAIAAAAGRMDRDEDVLFLHLTSHGAREGRLAAELWPLALPELTPQQLRQWLDEAGVRWRVISISACYAGSWIDALAAEGTLVMTAADADHTSYGCGRRSELTFFGRAVFDEQLRHHTRSFEQAHAAARPVIAQREQEAGKDDGYSNPQIRVGQDIRARLALLQARLEGHGAGRP